ncbi:MAG: B12-binding domain-containing radical SAM protein [Dongiaceae bacterium]
MRLGVLDLLADARDAGWLDRVYGAYFRRQFASIMPQAVSVWCRELGHDVCYRTYYGQADPRDLLPVDLDVVFVSAYTQASALAYALAKLYRADGALTVIGGPHAKAFPGDCLRFFDIVVKDCDRRLIEEILARRFDPPTVVTSGRLLTEFPSVEERMPEIAAASFADGRPLLTSVVPMLASLGCPYSCDFCIDWSSKYVPLTRDRIVADLRYTAEHLPNVYVVYHDPNFGVRFDEMMDVIEEVPAVRRSRYLMESSLSILKPQRLERLRATRCVYVAPGVESWTDYASKAGVGDRCGRAKLERVVDHFSLLREFVPGLQANFLFGTDADAGNEPVELTKEFFRRVPFVFPTVNIPTPFGGTPLHARVLEEGRILETMPFAFYFIPNLVIRIRNYDPVEYYGHLIDMHETISSCLTIARRLLADGPVALRFLHAVRSFGVKRDLAELRCIHRKLKSDRSFQAFHDQRSKPLPVYYRHQLNRRLGHYASLLSDDDLRPVLH